MNPKTFTQSFWKQLLFGVVAITVFFGGLEAVFTVAGVKPLLLTDDPFVGFAGNIPLFVEQAQQDGTAMLVTSESKLANFNKQQFPKIKSKNSYRIFCMGGSTTYGHPYLDQTSFCGWLRVFLRAADPSVNWEVVNAGGISYASYRVANLMNELSQYQPDLFIVYSGQNEFLEERTYRNIKDIPAWIKSTKGVLSRMRTYSVMYRAIQSLTRKDKKPIDTQHLMPGEVKEILSKSIGPTSYKRDDLLKNRIAEHYAFNLRRMAAIAQSSNSKIMFVTPASIMKDLPPFKSENKFGMTEVERIRWESLYRQGITLQESGKANDALEKFNEALAIDNRYADLHFRMGQALYDLRRFNEAKSAFQNAIDEDICQLRILSPMSKALRDFTAESGLPLIDFVKLIDDDCLHRYGHAIPGDEYFLDHVHPAIDGNRRLALSILDHLVGQRIAKPGAHWNEAAIAAVSKRVEQSIDQETRVLALRTLARTIGWSGRLEKSHDLLLQASNLEKNDKGIVFVELAESSVRRGEIKNVIDYYQKALKYWPNDVAIHDELAYYLQKCGKLREASRHYFEIIRLNSAQRENVPVKVDAKSIPVKYAANAHHQVAYILSAQGKTTEAITHYSEALRLKPDDDASHINIGTLLARSGRTDEAVAHYTAALKINPDSARAHNNLGIILEQRGKVAEAIRHYAEVLRIEPHSVWAHNNLGVAHAKQGNTNKAASFFSKALAIDPNNADAHYNMGMALEILNRKEESRFHFVEAQRIRKSVTALKQTTRNNGK